MESGTHALFGQLLLNGVRFSWGTHIYTQAQVDCPSGKLLLKNTNYDDNDALEGGLPNMDYIVTCMCHRFGLQF